MDSIGGGIINVINASWHQIIIQSGTVIASGGTYGAGIGGNNLLSSDITINGGDINASGGYGAAGIGGAYMECLHSFTMYNRKSSESIYRRL